MKSKLISLLCVTAALSACNGSGGGGSTSSSPNNDSVISKPVLRPVFLDDMGVIPVSNGISGHYTLNLNNVSDENYVVESVSVSPEDGKLVGISSAVCTSLPAKGYCSIQVTPKTNKSGSVLLTVNLRDSKDELKVIHQLIRMSNEVSGRGINFKSDLGTVVTPDGNYSISVPIVLEKDFTDIKAAYGRLLCSGFTKGNTCTLTMSGKSLGDKTLVSAHVTGYENGVEAEVDEDNVLVQVSDKAHLIVQHGTEVNVGEVVPVKIFNNGSGPATAVNQLSTDNALQIISQCTQVAANNSCEFSVKATSFVHGNALVNVGYHNGEATASTSTNITYLAQRSEADVEITATSGAQYFGFENLVAGFSAPQEFLIRNKGSTPIYNFATTLLSNPSTMNMTDVNGYPCSTLSVLDPGKTCKVLVTYAPKQTEKVGNALIRVTGKYKTVEGIEKSYLVSKSLKYSAIDGANTLTFKDTAATNALAVAVGKSGIKTYLLAKSADFNSIVTNLNITASPATGITITPATGCTALGGKDTTSCNVELVYSPKVLPSPNPTAQPVQLSVKYKLKDQNGTTLGTNFDLRGTDLQLTTLPADQSEVKATVDVVNSDILVDKEANGSIDEPYSFIASKNQQLGLKYTFTNSSTTEEITDFYIDSSVLLDKKVHIEGCGVGKPVTLPAEGACEVTVNAPSASWLQNFNAIQQGGQTSLIAGAFNIPLTYHYKGQNETLVRNINFTRDSAKVSYKVGTITKEPGNYTATIKATAAKLDHKVTISAPKPNEAKVTGCEITPPSNTCDVKVSFPRPAYDGMNVDLELVATDASTVNDPIHSLVNFDLTTFHVEPQVTMWSQPTYKNVISHNGLEKLPFKVKFKVSPEEKGVPRVSAKATSLQTTGVKLAPIDVVCDTEACVVTGTVTMPDFLTNLHGVPQASNIDFDVYLDRGDGDSTYLPQSAHIQEKSQYVMNYPTAILNTSATLAHTAMVSQYDKGSYAFTAPIEGSIIDGIPSLNTITGSKAGYTYIKIKADRLNTDTGVFMGKQDVVVYLSRVNEITGTGYPLFMSNPVFANEGVRVRSYIGGGTKLFKLENNGAITEQKGQSELNLNLPEGRYVGSFFLMRNGQPIKINIDWTQNKDATTPITTDDHIID